LFGFILRDASLCDAPQDEVFACGAQSDPCAFSRISNHEATGEVAMVQAHRKRSIFCSNTHQLISRIASRLSLSSLRINPWTRRLVRWKSDIPGAAGSLKHPIADIEAIASLIDP
jgi:hypothetical protein